MSVLVIGAPVFRRLVLRPIAQRAELRAIGVTALVLRPLGQVPLRVVGQVAGLNVAPRVSQLVLQPKASQLTLTAISSRLTVGLGQLGVRGPAGPAGASAGAQPFEISSELFNSERTELDGVIPFAPDPTKTVVVFMAGKGLLQRAAEDAVSLEHYQFQLFGDELRGIRFGYAPDPGSFGNGWATPS